MLCGCLLAHEALCNPGVDAEQDHEEGLQGVDDKHEIKGLLVGYTIEDEHGLDSEMPGTGTVGGGYDDGYGAYDEGDQGTGETETGSTLETEEREVVMDEITAPDGKGVEQEQGLVTHAAQRHHALPDATERGAHLVVDAETAQQEMEQDEGSNATDGSDEVTGKGEAGQDGVETGSCLLEEGAEDGHLPQQGGEGDEEYEEGVDGALGDHGAKGLGERHAVVLMEHSTAGELADAGHYEGGSITHEDAVDACHGTGMLAHGLERLSPAPATEHLGKGSEGHGE